MKLSLNVKGVDKIVKSFAEIPKSMQKYMVYAGRESADIVLDTQGIRIYPPSGPKPAMPMTDKQRRGFFAKLHSGEIEVPYRRGQSPGSEKFGTNWHITEKRYGVKATNRASYAELLVGDDQAGYMARIGWRKLSEVGEEKQDKVTGIFQKWVDLLIKNAGL